MSYVKSCRFWSAPKPGKALVMKKTVIILIVMAACLVFLVVCAIKLNEAPPVDSSTEAVMQSTAPSTSAPAETSLPTQPPTQPPEPTAPYINPLTGEPAYEQMTARPFAVMLNNYESAMPVHGASEADILYEALTEGGWTRCMGIFSDLSSVQTLGCIRSARRHFVNLAISYDAIYVHFGRSTGNVGAEEYMKEMGWNHIDGIDKAYAYFYESQDRLNKGYPWDAVHFLVGQRAIDYSQRQGFALNREKPFDFGLHFDEENPIAGNTANKLTVWFNESGKPNKWHKYTRFTYDEASKTYQSYQYGEDNIDGNTGEIISFRNVLALHAPTKKNTTSNHVIIDLEGTGTGYYACNGQVIPIKWSRSNVYEPFTYTLEDGTPLTFAVGKTYIGIIPTQATVEWE